MFEPSGAPRLFGMAPGIDFPAELHRGIVQRMQGRPPEAMAQVEVLVNNQRMQRRLVEQFELGGAMFLPRIRPITALGSDIALSDVPPAASALRLRLEISQLVAALLDSQPDLAPRAALYDLADSLASLMAEMHDEGVLPEALQALDVPDLSKHWHRSLEFVKIVERYFEAGSTVLTAEARQRIVIQRLIADWKDHPPEHPIIVAGSTGSRGTTALLMRAVADLPQGAIVLPGYDFTQPSDVWARMMQRDAHMDDHPQFRYARLLCQMDMAPDAVRPWSDAEPPNLARNALASLALRPAPVTNQWRTEGAAFHNLADTTKEITLIEAPSPRDEAAAIALVLRQAAERGETAALISPDRGLTRQVTASLQRWGIHPDDSAGQPLPQSAPGRLMRHVSALFEKDLTSEDLLILLKHPLVAFGSKDRGMHLLWTRELELYTRKNGPAFPTADSLRHWASRHDAGDGRKEWAEWLIRILLGQKVTGSKLLTQHLEAHITLSEALVCGPEGAPDELWAKSAGRKLAEVVTALRNEAGFGGDMGAHDYGDLFAAVLTREEVRDPTQPHPKIMIWGTLEARVQGADVIILGGLNDGVWPPIPPADPWLNREMRRRVGLTSPEQRVGLSAHDFQQAFGAKTVILSRAYRDAEAQTIASRWVNRWVNLLGGLSDGGAAALQAMRARGDLWLAMAAQMDQPTSPTPPTLRPSPRPPLDARPRKLSVTAIEKLIRDPYEVYARSVLKLNKLSPLRQTPDAPLRGTILHTVFERFIRRQIAGDIPLSVGGLLSVTDEVLAQAAPWPTTRHLWRAQVERMAAGFIGAERIRQSIATPTTIEARGVMELGAPEFTLVAKADRIDIKPDGSAIIYDYKSGSVPTPPMIEEFNKQLLLEAVMVEAGGFSDVPTNRVSAVSYIALGASSKDRWIEIEPGKTDTILAQFKQLIATYLDEGTGFTAKRAAKEMRFEGDYDHLSRYGEWELGDAPAPEDLT